jgi:hypothetical protein
MTLIVLDPFRIPAGGAPSYDPDVQTMLDARAALSDPTDAAYAQAISDYVEEIKSISGFWDDIIQLVVMAGATRIDSACVAIKGNNLTPISMVNTDVNIKTGVAGNGTTKYLRTGYSGNPSGTGQNDFHMYGHFTARNTTSGARTLFGNGGNAGAGRRVLVHSVSANNTPIRMNGSAAFNRSGRNAGDHGFSRSISSAFTSLVVSTLVTHTDTSVAASGGPYYILARGPNSGSTPESASHSNARILIWALGAGVDLTNYVTPRANLITALNAI